ncbi:methyl-accepting chemotaxis protein [Marinobacter gudaonensis]|uniref:Methyl-accepting chemotaxis protein n=1 Tax=Marinobacter gudaonensis TaxID=375760 RepID=A0A1I6HNX0_9GAMM|nr:methyl-accepting chemotaxis protein [Marinobacter gudaonensis]SFR56153.1 methyl-accepting chemotaxis protein [Marinobacter gudaonensis]
MAHVTQWFLDLSVRMKLMAGFGLVLLLTCGVAGAGLLAIDGIMDRANLVKQVARIHASLGLVREREKTFALTANNNLKEEVEKEIGRIVTLAGDAAARSNSQEYRSQFDAIARQSAQYLNAFNHYAEAKRLASDSQVVMGEKSRETLTAFASLEEKFFERTRAILKLPRMPAGDPVDLAETAVNFSRNLNRLRELEHQFLSTASPSVYQQWQDTFLALRQDVANFAAERSGSERAVLDAAGEALETYRVAFERYRRSMAAIAGAETRMQRTAADVLRRAEEVSVSQRSAMESVGQSSILGVSLMSALAVLLGIGAALVITRLILVPLRKTVEAAQRISGGDLTVSVSVQRSDELGLLAGSMCHMTQRLRELIGQISASTGTVTTESKRLSETAEATRLGVEHQQSETAQTAAAIEQMANSIREVATSAGDASSHTSAANQGMHVGRHLLESVQEQMRHLGGRLAQSADSVLKLETETHAIGTVLDVIKSVSEQTNLLALNAAIEAARAGEQGRGFAVVSDEVRGLAERTRHSAAEIEVLVVNLQAVATEAAREMQTSLAISQQVESAATEACESLSDVASRFSAIERMNQSIARAAEQQQLVGSSISDSVSQISQVGEQSAERADRTAIASADLARLAAELQTAVSRFRVGDLS